MPSSTDKQHNAMEAAAHGHSTLGIPKSVGEDYVAADKGSEHGTGEKFQHGHAAYAHQRTS